MFGFNKAPKVKTSISGINSIISEGTSVQGAMVFEGSIQVSGEVLGKMSRATESKDASVSITKTGVVNSDLMCDNVIVAGTVNGNIHASSVYITSTGRVNGKVSYMALQTEPGAQVNGEMMCLITDESKITVTILDIGSMSAEQPAGA